MLKRKAQTTPWCCSVRAGDRIPFFPIKADLPNIHCKALRISHIQQGWGFFFKGEPPSTKLALDKGLPLETEGRSSLICLVKQKQWEACWQLEIAVLWENSHICQEGIETSVLWKTTGSLIVQPAPPAHPTRLAHPAGRAGAGDGVCEAGERKGREQNAEGKKK